MLAILRNNVTVVPLDDFFHDGKTDTGTVLVLVLRPVEPLEQLRQLFWGYTSAIIFNDTEECGFRSIQLYPNHTVIRGVFTGIF